MSAGPSSNYFFNSLSGQVSPLHFLYLLSDPCIHHAPSNLKAFVHVVPSEGNVAQDLHLVNSDRAELHYPLLQQTFSNLCGYFSSFRHTLSDHAYDPLWYLSWMLFYSYFYDYRIHVCLLSYTVNSKNTKSVLNLVSPRLWYPKHTSEMNY